MIKPPTALRIFIAVLCVATVAHAQEKKKSPTSKIYVVEVNGDGQIDTGKEIDDLVKRGVFSAEGAILETKANSNASVVLSNGTGIYFDVGTRVEFRKFEQEAFRPDRGDMDDEPSISRTQLVVDYGVIALSLSKLVAATRLST